MPRLLFYLEGRDLAVNHHRNDRELAVFDKLEIGTAFVQVHQLIGLAVRMEAVESSVHPVRGEPFARSVRFEPVEIADRRSAPDVRDRLCLEVDRKQMARSLGREIGLNVRSPGSHEKLVAFDT